MGNVYGGSMSEGLQELVGLVLLLVLAYPCLILLFAL